MDDHRIFARIKVKLSLKFFNKVTEKEGEGETLDISANGVCFISKESLIPDTPIDIKLNIPEYAEPLSLSGKVAWSKPADAFGNQKIGVAIEMEDEDVVSLGRILRLLK